jgi:polyisoprenyl-phosphate glycosyltransferase
MKKETKMKTDISIVIPLHNEALVINTVFHEIVENMKNIALSYMIILIDDGSSDNTWELIKEIKHQYPEIVTGIKLSRNFGKDAALFAGLKQSDSHCVITMDADGQHPPSYIKKFVNCWQLTGCNIVNGVKSSRKYDGFIQRCLAMLFNSVMSKITKFDFANASDFKLLDRQAVTAVLSCGDRNIFYRALVAWVGFDQQKIKFEVSNGYQRNSRWGLSGLLNYAMNGIVLFSNFPIYLILILGIFSIILCSGLTISLGIQLLLGNVPSGYSTLLVMSLLNLGFSMIAIGCVGLYVKNGLEQTKDRPRFMVEFNL